MYLQIGANQRRNTLYLLKKLLLDKPLCQWGFQLSTVNVNVLCVLHSFSLFISFLTFTVSFQLFWLPWTLNIEHTHGKLFLRWSSFYCFKYVQCNFRRRFKFPNYILLQCARSLAFSVQWKCFFFFYLRCAKFFLGWYSMLHAQDYFPNYMNQIKTSILSEYNERKTILRHKTPRIYVSVCTNDV